MSRFLNRVAVITGGTAGIGYATAQRFLEEGATVAIVGRSLDRGATSIETLGGLGPVSFHQADVSDYRQLSDAFSHIVEKYGKFDICFNNAGVSADGKELIDLSNKTFDDVMKTNVYGTYYSMKIQIDHYLHTGGGKIVNCASVSGLVGAVNQSAYVASKHAIIGLTKAAALEYASRNININAVCPGGVDTRSLRDFIRAVPPQKRSSFQSPAIGRIAQPSEIAGVVAFLCSEDANNMVGSSVVTDGGFTVC